MTVRYFRVELDGDVIESLIEFTYTGTIELTLLEVQAMMVAATQLKFITVTRVSESMVVRGLWLLEGCVNMVVRGCC